MKLNYHGHACFSLEGSEGKVIIDPFLSGNPRADIKPEQVDVDAILVSHGHGDHLGDAIAISRRTGALIIAPFELAVYCQKKGANTHGMHIGGSRKFPFGRVKLTQALHGSGIEEDGNMVYGGNPCGFMLEMDEFTVYHAGDTGLFGDMELLGKLHRIDLALLPIGDNYVMGVDDAVMAAQFLKAKRVIPMHYNTFELIKQDPQEFARKVEEFARCLVLNSGQNFEL